MVKTLITSVSLAGSPCRAFIPGDWYIDISTQSCPCCCLSMSNNVSLTCANIHRVVYVTFKALQLVMVALCDVSSSTDEPENTQIKVLL